MADTVSGAAPAALWTVEEVAEFLSLSRRWVYRAVAEGAIPHVRLGRSVRFDPSAIREWTAARSAGGNQ